VGGAGGPGARTAGGRVASPPSGPGLLPIARILPPD
jgi:hypothetical protein